MLSITHLKKVFKMSSPDKILKELNRTLDSALKENESFLERIGRYCANQRESLLSKKSSVVAGALAATSQTVAVGHIIAQIQGVIPDSPSNHMFALGCMALGGAIIATYASHHILTKKIMDPILSHVNFNRFDPEKVAKIFSGIISEKLYGRNDIPAHEKDCVFANLKDSLVEKAGIHYNGLNRFESFSNTEEYAKMINAIKITTSTDAVIKNDCYQKRSHTSELGMG